MGNVIMDPCGGIQMAVSLEMPQGILSASDPILVQVSQGPVSASCLHGFHGMLGHLK